MTRPATATRIPDAPSGNWVYRALPYALWPYAQLARWDRPIGWWLLLWPCWWSLALVAGVAELSLFEGLAFGALFLIGAIAMRGAGCTYNDIVDAGIDAKVERTALRPIPSGRVSRRQGLIFLIAQLAVGLLVLLVLVNLRGKFNGFALGLAFLSLLVVLAYPFAKRVTNWPQLVLGLAFSWGALMGWAVVLGDLNRPAIGLYAAAVLWTIGYDTIYAHQDKEDDALIGVKSTALLFGPHTKAVLGVLYTLSCLLLALAVLRAESAWPAYAGIAAGGGHMIWQIARLDIDDGARCLALFRSNTQFGWIIFAGLIAALLI
jgi:4-hydroxybenzoate polyprenyltransferase